jgi:hypothetical protein
MPTTHCNSGSYTFNDSHDSPHQDTCAKNFTNASECGGNYFINLGLSGDGFAWTNASECGGSYFVDTTPCANNRDHTDDPFYDHTDDPFYNHTDDPFYDHTDTPAIWYDHYDVAEYSDCDGYHTAYCTGSMRHPASCNGCCHIDTICPEGYPIRGNFVHTHPHAHSWSPSHSDTGHADHGHPHVHYYTGDSTHQYQDYSQNHEHTYTGDSGHSGLHYVLSHEHTYTGDSGHSGLHYVLSHYHIPHINFCNHVNT